MEGNKELLDAMVGQAVEALEKNTPLIKEAYDNAMYFEAANMMGAMIEMLNSVGQAVTALHIETYGEADLNQRIMMERMKRDGTNN